MAIPKFSIEQDIQPLSEFRKNAADFIGRLKHEKRSIVLTQHGKSAAVLVDVSEYQHMIDHSPFNNRRKLRAWLAPSAAIFYDLFSIAYYCTLLGGRIFIESVKLNLLSSI